MKAKIGKVEFNLVARPLDKAKKGKGSFELVVNGTPTTAVWTSNAGWSKGRTLDYIWFNFDGKRYFLTLDYNVAAKDYAGSKVTVSEGTADRKDPERVDFGATELDRRKKFDEAMAAKKLAVMFRENIAKFGEAVPAGVLAAGPQG